MVQVVEQLKQTIKQYIAQNPTTVVVEIYPTKDNGYGMQIPDIDATPEIKTLGTVRVSRRRLPDMFITNARSPYDYQDVHYAIGEYDAEWMQEGLIFESYNEKYRMKKIEARIIFGSIVYKLCDLEQITQMTVEDML